MTDTFIEEKVAEFQEFAQGEGGKLLTMDDSDYPDVENYFRTALTRYGEAMKEEGAREVKSQEIVQDFVLGTDDWCDELIGYKQCPQCGVIPNNLKALAKALTTITTV